jgi:sulfide:quinone oxidoreductase
MADQGEHARPDDNANGLRVLIAGAGVAGLEAAFALRSMAGERVELTLIAPVDEFVYRPMAVAEPFSSGSARRYPLARLAAEADAQLVHDALVEVDTENRRVQTSSGKDLPYDALLVALGATMQPSFEHATIVDDARIDELLHGLVQDIEQGLVRDLAVVVPAPTPWPLPAYEIALMSSERAWDMQVPMRVTVLTPESTPLAAFGGDASLEVSRLLTERHVDVVTSAYCEVPTSKTVRIRPGDRTLEVDRVVALPALRGPAVPGLPRDGGGFIPVDAYGRVRNVDHVWAAGDGTDFPIKHGGVAAQLADTAAQSIASLTGAWSVAEPFDPVLEGVLLTGASPVHLRGHVTGGRGAQYEIAKIARAAAPPKISAHYLTPHLTDHS